MPTRPLRPCTAPRCPALTSTGRCAAHQRQAWKARDATRGSSTERGYDGKWRKARLVWLDEHPLCAACESKGQVTAATVVDHIEPHKGDRKKFWSRSNWQSLCATCHNKKTANEAGTFGRPDRAPLR